ncbi:MAG: hypothetical protein SPK00_05805 [Corynebacterium glucuronolyticum]|nr:hypothetical protein [Mycobacteriaceae bacterium]MDY5834250.1 hypothetical protein [Corynebacterium glucuronolyticum]
MGATNPKRLAAVGFGFGFTGGDLVGWGDWMPFLGIVVVTAGRTNYHLSRRPTP